MAFRQLTVAEARCIQCTRHTSLSATTNRCRSPTTESWAANLRRHR